ncbi:MAG: exodeoxyribonuclease VII large subunit [Wolinella sp.]
MSGILSVNELNIQIKSLLEATFLNISVRGEVSNLTYHTSGHVYFTLKDSSSSIKAVLFKGNAKYLKFRIENGMDLTIHGGLSVYTPRGEYQIIAQSAEPTGIGGLALAFEQLKKELASLGYFDSEKKKLLPKFPERIALITSATGAALQDMLRVASKRWSGVRILVLNTLVQGDDAKESIARNIAYADTLGVNVIVVARGGGSIEDLWAFNEKCVALAIFNAKTPIVSAVGHESDVVISDFVADLRAPTPSAAMELILPDSREWLLRLDSMIEEMGRAFKRALERKKLELDSLKSGFSRSWIPLKIDESVTKVMEHRRSLQMTMGYKLGSFSAEISPLELGLKGAWEAQYRSKVNNVTMLKAQLSELNPMANLARGYVRLSDSNGKNQGIAELAVGEEFVLQDLEYKIRAQVVEKQRKSE